MGFSRLKIVLHEPRSGLDIVPFRFWSVQIYDDIFLSSEPAYVYHALLTIHDVTLHEPIYTSALWLVPHAPDIGNASSDIDTTTYQLNLDYHDAPSAVFYHVIPTLFLPIKISDPEHICLMITKSTATY